MPVWPLQQALQAETLAGAVRLAAEAEVARLAAEKAEDVGIGLTGMGLAGMAHAEVEHWACMDVAHYNNI